MNVFVEMALGWLIVGSLIAGAVLAEHFHSGSKFPEKAGRLAHHCGKPVHWPSSNGAIMPGQAARAAGPTTSTARPNRSPKPRLAETQ